MLWPASPRILSENLVPVAEPLALALRTAGEAAPRTVALAAARALLDRSPLAPEPWPAWLAPHQIPAARRLTAILGRYGGALLADEVGLGKSYVALAVALRRSEPFALLVPAVLTHQWLALLSRFDVAVPVLTHEQLSTAARPTVSPSARLLVVDEAHRFRNPDTKRYRALAELAVGRRLLLLTATPVHNRIGDLFHLFRLFMRDHELAALGVPSLRRAALGEIDVAAARAAAARLIVARSRGRVTSGYGSGPVSLAFPRHSSATRVRAGPASDDLLAELVSGIRGLQSGGGAAPLLRLLLLRRLASSLPAFDAALRRHDAYLDLTGRAQAEGRRLTSREFLQLFPGAAEPALQLVLFPVLLEDGVACLAPGDRRELARLRALTAAAAPVDPKADALRRLLEEDSAKTIVFTDALPTVRHLLHVLRLRRTGAVYGRAGRFTTGPASRAEVLRAFAPRAQQAAPPGAALRTDTLIATDLLSEGLNLQDARRVVHYDLPWSPARMSQRVGRIDRLDSPHQCIESVTFLPPAPLADAIAIEERLATKAHVQNIVGSAGSLDWCDRLDGIAQLSDFPAPTGAFAAASSSRDATVLVVRVGGFVEAIVVRERTAVADPGSATEFLEEACSAAAVPCDTAALQCAIQIAAPLVRERLNAVQNSRWRAADRDQLARRLIPWVLSAARRAARRGDSRRLDALDAVVSRLAQGMTAGEELSLSEVLSRRSALTAGALCDWHAGLPPLRESAAEADVELVAALTLQSQ